MNGEQCENCQFFRDQGGNWPDHGLCRRYPPAFSTSGDQQDIESYAEFPSVRKDDWCGEFKRLEEGAL